MMDWLRILRTDWIPPWTLWPWVCSGTRSLRSTRRSREEEESEKTTVLVRMRKREHCLPRHSKKDAANVGSLDTKRLTARVTSRRAMHPKQEEWWRRIQSCEIPGKCDCCGKYGCKETGCWDKNGKPNAEKNNNQAIKEAEGTEDVVVLFSLCDEVELKEEPKEAPWRETSNEELGEWQKDNQEPNDNLESNQDPSNDQERGR